MEKDCNIWHNAAITRPEHSGKVVVMTMGGYITSLHYNSEVDLFNVSDPDDIENAIDVMAWAHYKDVCADISRQVNFDVIEKSDRYYFDIWNEEDGDE